MQVGDYGFRVQWPKIHMERDTNRQLMEARLDRGW